MCGNDLVRHLESNLQSGLGALAALAARHEGQQPLHVVARGRRAGRRTRAARAARCADWQPAGKQAGDWRGAKQRRGPASCLRTSEDTTCRVACQWAHAVATRTPLGEGHR